MSVDCPTCGAPVLWAIRSGDPWIVDYSRPPKRDGSPHRIPNPDKSGTVRHSGGRACVVADIDPLLTAMAEADR